jgi:hypothetical protein
MKFIAIAAINLGLAEPAVAARVFTTIPQPQGTYYDGSAGWGVAPSGEVVGAFFMAQGGENGAEGFTYSSGAVSVLNYPNAGFTVWHGLNK